MNIKFLGILGTCGLIMSSNAFAYMTPQQKSTVAQNQYEKNQGAHAKTAANVYSDDLNQNQKDNVKADELQHRKNIQDQHINTIKNH